MKLVISAELCSCSVVCLALAKSAGSPIIIIRKFAEYTTQVKYMVYTTFTRHSGTFYGPLLRIYPFSSKVHQLKVCRG